MEGMKSDIQTVHNENSFKLCKLEITFLSYTVSMGNQMVKSEIRK